MTCYSFRLIEVCNSDPPEDPRHYPPRFGAKLVSLFKSFCESRHDSTEDMHSQGTGSDLASLFQSQPWADLWHDAEMTAVVQYLMGNNQLSLPSALRSLFPSRL